MCVTERVGIDVERSLSLLPRCCRDALFLLILSLSGDDGGGERGVRLLFGVKALVRVALFAI